MDVCLSQPKFRSYQNRLHTIQSCHQRPVGCRIYEINICKFMHTIFISKHKSLSRYLIKVKISTYIWIIETFPIFYLFISIRRRKNSKYLIKTIKSRDSNPNPESAVFFINCQKSQSTISVPDLDPNFFFNINVGILRYLFHVKDVCKISKNQHVSNWTYGLFDQSYRVAILSTLYITVSWIIIPSFK